MPSLRQFSGLSRLEVLSPLFFIALTALFLALLSAPVLAEVDAGLLLRQTQPQAPQVPQLPPPQATPEEPVMDKGPKLLVKGFNIQGASQFSDALLQEALSDLVNHELSFADIQKAADTIVEYYREQGYLARAYIPAHDVANGIVVINVVEATLGETRLEEGTQSRLDSDVAKNHLLSRQKPGERLNMNHVQRATKLLNELPGVLSATVLAPGSQPSQSDIVIQLKDKPIIAGNAMIDSGAARSTGIWRGSTQLALNNLAGFGDQAQLQFQKNAGTTSGKVEYSLPVGYDGLRAGVYLTGMEYALVGELAALDAHGNAVNAGINLNYPLLRSRAGNVRITGSYDRKFFKNYALGAETSDKFLDTVNLGVSGDKNDTLAGGGVFQASLGLTGGRVAQRGNGLDLAIDQRTGKREGGYVKLSYAFNRIQRITTDTSFWASFSGQFAGKNLDSSEKFMLGGPAGVRAYPLLEGSGDEGWLFTAELRHNLGNLLQGSVFFDHGSIKRNHDPWRGAGKLNLYQLNGVGGSLSLSDPDNYAIKLTIATPLSVNPARDAKGDDSDGRQADPRFWLNAIKFF